MRPNCSSNIAAHIVMQTSYLIRRCGFPHRISATVGIRTVHICYHDGSRAVRKDHPDKGFMGTRSSIYGSSSIMTTISTSSIALAIPVTVQYFLLGHSTDQEAYKALAQDIEHE